MRTLGFDTHGNSKQKTRFRRAKKKPPENSDGAVNKQTGGLRFQAAIHDSGEKQDDSGKRPQPAERQTDHAQKKGNDKHIADKLD
ncbi:MAG: hypothetical protein D8H97_14570 [Neisseria sp.]|nr:MAG: hypothetical protein D8H97_14570 [Neisseria sp.]